MLGNDHFKPFPNIAKLLYHKYSQITNAQNIVFKPFVECFNTSKLPLKCYI